MIIINGTLLDNMFIYLYDDILLIFYEETHDIFIDGNPCFSQSIFSNFSRYVFIG